MIVAELEQLVDEARFLNWRARSEPVSQDTRSTLNIQDDLLERIQTAVHQPAAEN